MKCIYCGDAVAKARWNIGKKYCMSKICHAKASDDFYAEYRLILVPKQGFAIVPADSDDLHLGKSSGRQ